MAYTSSVTYSGMSNQNSQRLKDIQKAENTAKAYCSSLGGSTERISYWDVDANGNVSHYAHVRREDKLNEKLREEANENAKELIEKNREKNGVSYETTISNAVASGLSYIQSMEKQLNGTKFFVGTVSYGQIYGNSTDTNFVVNLYQARWMKKYSNVLKG